MDNDKSVCRRIAVFVSLSFLFSLAAGMWSGGAGPGIASASMLVQ